MTDTLLRMTYLGDGISTDDEELEEEENEESDVPFVPGPTEEGGSEENDPFENPDEA
jgi:hypothetical protein